MAPIGASGDVRRFFRLSVEVGDLDEALVFYGRLFGMEGRRQAGARAYFECGLRPGPVGQPALLRRGRNRIRGLADSARRSGASTQEKKFSPE